MELLALILLVGLTLMHSVVALDNGAARVPPMGWSSWYGFTSNINEKMVRDMADGMISSGLAAKGYQVVSPCRHSLRLTSLTYSRGAMFNSTFGSTTAGHCRATM